MKWNLGQDRIRGGNRDGTPFGTDLRPDRRFGADPLHRKERRGGDARMNAVSLADFLSDSRKISFDLVIQTMYETGKDISRCYRETAEGGLGKAI